MVKNINREGFKLLATITLIQDIYKFHNHLYDSYDICDFINTFYTKNLDY